MIGILVLVFIALLVVGAMPTWPYSAQWGYGPSGGLGLVAIVVILLLLFGRL
jgi:hypothetical protein